MKKSILSILVVLKISIITVNIAQSQIGINNTTPHNSAVFDLKFKNEKPGGILLPRMNTPFRYGIVSATGVPRPAHSLLLFDTDLNKYVHFDSTTNRWLEMNPFYAVANDPQNGIFRGNIGIGTTSPIQKLHIVNNNVRIDNGNITITGGHIRAGNFFNSAGIAMQPKNIGFNVAGAILVSDQLGNLYPQYLDGDANIGADGILTILPEKITSEKLGKRSVWSNHIVKRSITSEHIYDYSIFGNKLNYLAESIREHSTLDLGVDNAYATIASFSTEATQKNAILIIHFDVQNTNNSLKSYRYRIAVNNGGGSYTTLHEFRTINTLVNNSNIIPIGANDLHNVRNFYVVNPAGTQNIVVQVYKEPGMRVLNVDVLVIKL